ncbi:hypothetical protein K1719_020650 [Acacia pycnantha]|nr:hypothetical protein K1719_020650 [Acacia pycnantha]
MNWFLGGPHRYGVLGLGGGDGRNLSGRINTLVYFRFHVSILSKLSSSSRAFDHCHCLLNPSHSRTANLRAGAFSLFSII